MRVGGNQQLVDFFRRHKLDGLPIGKKYRSVQAALYRARIKALVAGEMPPGDDLMAAYEDEAEWRPADDASPGAASGARSGGASAGSGSRFTAGGATLRGDEAGESEHARQMRLRAEAQERMRTKFGSGGLSGSGSGSGSGVGGGSGGMRLGTAGVSMGGVGSGARPRPVRAGGSSDPADEIAAVAGSAWSFLSSVVTSGAAAVATGAQVVGAKVGEGVEAARRSELGKHVSAGVTSGVDAIRSSELGQTVGKGATDLWVATATGARHLLKESGVVEDEEPPELNGAGSGAAAAQQRTGYGSSAGPSSAGPGPDLSTPRSQRGANGGVTSG